MDVLRRLFLIVPLVLFVSCAKIGYLIEQGMGQLRLQTSSKSNESMINDPIVSIEVKNKIRKIEELKKYFYKYFEKKESSIYSKTTILKSNAVTHLVIASKYYEIRPKNECFVFMGCFPYLGFFKETSANDYQKKLETEDYVTWKRPVYAYSTLGYLNDNILSSFFFYDDFELAEMIFHELFHTIFFVKDEIDLNENLANYFGLEMALGYFNYSAEMKRDFLKDIESKRQLRLFIVELIEELKKEYKILKREDRSAYQTVFDNFMAKIFRPQVSKRCSSLGIKDCFPLQIDWNNAAFSAFLTYEKEADYIKKLHQKSGTLKKFLEYLNQQYEIYGERDDEIAFTDYLKSQS